MAKSIRKILKSFTLVELVIVIAIIVVLGSVAFLILSHWMGKSKDVNKISDLKTIEKSINLSLLNNGILPIPDDYVDVVFSGNTIWQLGYFGTNAIEQAGGTITKLPIDPTTKERYRYAQWNNTKYQLGTIVENIQYSKFSNRSYAKESYIRLQGSYDQTIIVAIIDGVDNLLPIPSLIIDKIEGPIIDLDEDKFWISKQKYTAQEDNTNTIKIQSLYSGNISYLKESANFTIFKSNYQNVYSGLQDFILPFDDENVDVILLEEVNKVLSIPVNIELLSCDGIAHGKSKSFYSTGSVNHGQSCSSYEKVLTCNDGKWMDGLNEADLITYKYSGCIVGNPIDCPVSNIDKLSVSGINIVFDLPVTEHGLTFEVSKDVPENNGIYEYKLSGNCNNGIYEQLLLSDPIYKTCNTGYEQSGNSCVPIICAESSQTVNGHIYNVGALNHLGTSAVTSNSIPITNGTITYTQTFQCNLGIITTSGSETTNTPTCNTPYVVSGSSCILNNYFQGGGTNGNPWMKSGGLLLTSCKAYNLSAYTLNNGTLRGAGTCGDGTKACLSSGIYKIDPDGGSTSNSFEVYCNMTTDGGGWTLVHKTTNSATDLVGGLNTTEGTPDWTSVNEYRLTIDYWKGLSTEKAMAMNIRIDGVSWNDIQSGYITAISTSGVTFSQTDTYRIFNVGTTGNGQNDCTSGTYYWNAACCSRCVNYDTATSYGSPINSPMVNTSSISYVGSALEGAGGTNDSTRHRLSKMGIFLR